MKTLYLVRHAKSSWNFDKLNDFQRPLGKRGRRDVRRMGIYVKKNVPAPDLIITSAASRAFYTALFLADAWEYPEENIIASEVLYHADVHQFESFVKEVKDFSTVAVFAHNPGLTMFYNKLCSKLIDNIPTCGIVGLSFPIDSWRDLMKVQGERLFFHIPKKI